jgi:ribonuclease HIII
MISKKHTKKELNQLEKLGFFYMPTTSEHELLRMNGSCTVVLYKSGKLLFQGNDDEVRKVKELFGMVEKQATLVIERSEDELIGTDEALKGDTFGGLVVAGFRADKKERAKLELFGVQDSKNLTDDKIVVLAKKLIEFFPHNFHVENISVEDYNNTIEALGLTNTLNALHKKCFKFLEQENYLHVVDKYPGCKVGDIMETKAESKYLEVAAASIIARAKALEQFDELTEKAGFRIPKGSTHVKLALEQLKKSDLNPREFVKMHFKNVQQLF